MRKYISVVLIAVLIIINFANYSYCQTSISPSGYDGETSETRQIQGDMINVGQVIATWIRNIGLILAVIILMILGVKYILGSVEEKADYKKSMIPYLVGVAILFSAAAIAQIIVNLA